MPHVIAHAMTSCMQCMTCAHRQTTHPYDYVVCGYGGKHPKQQSNCGTHVVEFFLSKSSGMILALHKIYPPHDARGTATDSMILVAKWPWFMGDKHEARACEFICPDAHAFV